MKALVLHGPNDIRYEPNWPDPEPGPGEVLLRMTYSSICQTDIEVWKRGGLRHEGRQGKPFIQGHEAAGVVAAPGKGVTTLAVGDRVAIENVRVCGKCFWCQDGQAALCQNGRNFGFTDNGGLAELAVWPETHCIKLPDSISNEEAPLSEPVTVGVHAVRRSGVRVGDTAAVIGCGVVGLATLQVLRAAGARVIAIDRRPESLALAAQLGASDTINVADADAGEVLPGLTRGIGPDVIIETAGAHGTAADAVKWVRRGGRAVIAGFVDTPTEFDFRIISGAEKTVTGTTAANPGDYRKAVELIADGRVNVKPLISAKVSLERGIPDGFERMLRPTKDVFRILVGNG
jgi:(R,R)-butanediol dehydrogenase/meso-butanediol dehydrogenase/diacetyl reductase